MLTKADKDIILHFRGNLDYDTIGELITTLRESMKNRGVRFGLFKKMLTLMIESLENVVRYNSGSLVQQALLNEYPPEMIISKKEDCFLLETSNVIHNSDASTLSDKLTTLNNSDLDTIKELYRTTITNGKFSDKGGAGLGMIEMAKIVENKINFSFHPVDDQHSFFILRLCIQQPEDPDK